MNTVSWSGDYVAPPCNYDYYTNYTLVISHYETAALHHYPDQPRETQLKKTISTLTMTKLMECSSNGHIASLLGCLSAGRREKADDTNKFLLHNWRMTSDDCVSPHLLLSALSQTRAESLFSLAHEAGGQQDKD